MDRGSSDVALRHNVYYNYENLGGLTGQWEPENTDEDSNASSSTPTSPKHRSEDTESNIKKDSNENFTNGRTSICDNPESPTFPRFPDITEDLVGSPLKIPSSPIVMKTLEAAETSDGDIIKRKRSKGVVKEEKHEESPAGNGEGVRWVFNTPFFYPNGTESPLYGSDYDDSDNSVLSLSSTGSGKKKSKQNNRLDKDNKDLRKLLGLEKKKPAKKQGKSRATHSEIKKLLTSPAVGNQVSGFSPACPENAIGMLSALAQKTVANISNGGLNIPMSPFENCTMPCSTPGAIPESGSNRKGRRKNINNSRQLSQMSTPNGCSPNSNSNSPVYQGLDLTMPSPKKRSPGLPKINLSGSPIVIAPDQHYRQQYPPSPEKDDEFDEQQEHSTFDCTVCKQSVCKLLGNNRNGAVISDNDTSIDGSCHICEYCNMAFPSGQKLKSHLRCHIKPFPCTVCKKSFTNSGNLKKHMRTHTGEKPYRCPLCDAAWANPSNLKRHMLKHDIHKCSSCEKDFPNSCTMSVVTERLTGNRLYVCQNCLADNSTKYLKGKQQNRPFP